MPADAEERSFTRHMSLTAAVPIAGLLGVVLLNCSGCAYFRTEPVSYQELEERNKESEQHRQQFLNDGYYGSWKP